MSNKKEWDEFSCFDDAIEVFKDEEDREPNLNTMKDLTVVSAIQVGIMYARRDYDKWIDNNS